MDKKKFKEKKEPVMKLIFESDLQFTDEDKKQLTNLTESYFRKRTRIVNSNIENMAGGLLWVYSRINFLFEHNDPWSQKNIAKLFGIRPKTVSSTASKIMDALRIDYFDERFARKEIAEKNPLNDFFMTQSGFILNKNDIKDLLNKQTFEESVDDKSFEDSNEKNKLGNMHNEVQKEKTIDTKSNETRNKKLQDFFK